MNSVGDIIKSVLSIVAYDVEDTARKAAEKVRSWRLAREWRLSRGPGERRTRCDMVGVAHRSAETSRFLLKPE